eukprot:scaffold867_cov317-Pavlova_lutheri.AAC.49
MKATKHHPTPLNSIVNRKPSPFDPGRFPSPNGEERERERGGGGVAGPHRRVDVVVGRTRSMVDPPPFHSQPGIRYAPAGKSQTRVHIGMLVFQCVQLLRSSSVS